MKDRDRQPRKEAKNEYGCDITEARFPCVDRCCDKLLSLTGTVFEPRCPHCRIWTSLPDGDSLKVAAIIECGLYGYGRRIIK